MMVQALAWFSLGMGVLLLSARAPQALAASEFALVAEGLTVEKLADAEAAFERGRFSDAATLVDALLASENSLLEPERARAFLLKSRLSLAFERRDEMLFWLERLAAIDAGVAPDAMRDPPDVMHAWERARARRALATVSVPTPMLAPVPEAPALVKLEGDLRREARFWVSLIPFGVGHFVNGQVFKGLLYGASEASLVLFTSGLIESTRLEAEEISGPWESRVGDEDAIQSDRESALSVLAGMGFLGFWGYELNSRMPELMRANPTAAKATRFALSFAPFGAAQAKNGEALKALGFATAELSFLVLSVTLPRQSQREWATYFLWGSFLGGAIDGWINHDWNRGVPDRDAWRLGFGLRQGVPVVNLSVGVGP